MAFAFFSIPASSGADPSLPLNVFLRSHRVLRVTQQWHEASGGWAFCVEYAEGGAKQVGGAGQATAAGPSIDYREVLPAEQFSVYSQLRELRKTLAERDGQQAFAVFTNAQLAEMVKRQCQTLEELKAIPGIGDARATKYGQDVLLLLKAMP